MLPGVQITIVILVAIILLSCIGTMIFLLVDLIKDRRERKKKAELDMKIAKKKRRGDK